MCPLRFILVFLSAVLAGYFAWRSVLSSPEIDGKEDSSPGNSLDKEKDEFCSRKMVQNGFWVFVDMASGRYLWENLKEVKNAIRS